MKSGRRRNFKAGTSRHWPFAGKMARKRNRAALNNPLSRATLLKYAAPAISIILLLASAGAASDTNPSPSPDSSGRIVFRSYWDGLYEIFAINADGSGRIRLTENSADEQSPAWSPNGDKIVFASKRDGNWEVYLMNTDGSEQTRLTTDPNDDYDPSWSPDGSKIAFFSKRGGEDHIYLMNADGSGQTRLTSNSLMEYQPVWSPDGSKIAFVGKLNDRYQIYVMNANGTDPIPLTNFSSATAPAWSPDGSKIAFQGIESSGYSSIYVMNADGSNKKLLRYGICSHPAWSPDGSKIAFSSSLNSSYSHIYVMNANGTDSPTRLTNVSMSDEQPHWSPATVPPIVVTPIQVNDQYFPWYDSKYGSTWLLMANPWGSGANNFDVFLGNTKMNPDPYAVEAAPFTPIYVGQMGGPVKVVPQESKPVLVSERSLFGNSFEEIWATPYESLDSHYFWPAYDQATPGMQNWVLVANPSESSDAVEAEVRLHIPYEYGGDEVVTKVIAPGESWAPSFPGIHTGPVEVQAWKAYSDRGDPVNARKVIASQRVLWKGAFNEMQGIPHSKLSSAYVWTWYDNNSPQAYNEILIADAEMTGEGGSPYVKVIIGDYLVFSGYIHSEWTTVLRSPKGSPSGMGGPVFVYSCNNPEKCDGPGQPIFASQRIFWGPSFGEIAGTPIEKITDNAHWTWYDQRNPGVLNWVLVSNLTGADAYVEFKIGGKLVDQKIIAGWSSYTPTFPNYMDGPVEVKAWKSELDGSGQQKKAESTDILASQRVLWNGYFNEIVGQGL